MAWVPNKFISKFASYLELNFEIMAFLNWCHKISRVSKYSTRIVCGICLNFIKPIIMCASKSWWQVLKPTFLFPLLITINDKFSSHLHRNAYKNFINIFRVAFYNKVMTVMNVFIDGWISFLLFFFLYYKSEKCDWIKLTACTYAFVLC